MNHCVPDWSVQDDSRHGLPPSANYSKSIWPEDELVELLWQNGHVVMHSQTQRKAMESSPIENKQCQKPESMVKHGPIKNAGNMVQEEASPWLLNYTMDGDSFDKEFCQEFLCELPTAGTPEKDVTFSAGSVLEQSNVPPSAETVMPHQPGFVASITQGTDIAGSAGDRSFTPFSSTTTGEPLNGNGDRSRWIRGEGGEASSTMAKESSICGSNQLHNFFFRNTSYTDTAKLALGRGMEEDVMDLGRPKGVQSPHYEDAPSRHSHERAQTDAREIPITSSSGGSGLTVGREGQPSANTRNQKRKGRDAEEYELQSEEAEYESMETGRESQRSASARRRRATEVHNLSERRRRDRINEKMKALQELIPHCNKSDKASMLDEVIEYLKSLQMQVQMMWMRSGLAPMMFPGVHHYMPQMGMGMAHSSMPSIHGPIPFPRMPLVNQHVSPNPTANQASFYPPSNPPNFPIQMQHPHLPISYARCLGFQHMRPPPQIMNFFPYDAKLMQQSQAALGAGSSAPCAGDAPSENVRKDGNTGKEHT